MAAYALPRADAEQQTTRSAAIQAALHQATQVPLACAEAGLTALELSAIVSEQGHLNAIGESAVAAEAARTAFRASALNVSINLGSIRDRAFVDSRRAELERLQRRFVELDGRIQELLAKRLG
jgi:formiminotetrahydrofolate cyclodeaminase